LKIPVANSSVNEINIFIIINGSVVQERKHDLIEKKCKSFDWNDRKMISKTSENLCIVVHPIS